MALPIPIYPAGYPGPKINGTRLTAQSLLSCQFACDDDDLCRVSILTLLRAVLHHFMALLNATPVSLVTVTREISLYRIGTLPQLGLGWSYLSQMFYRRCGWHQMALLPQYVVDWRQLYKKYGQQASLPNTTFDL